MRMIFVNLPVSDLQASRRFYEAIGFSPNEEFTDDGAAAMVLEENIWVMLLTEDRFRDFINDEIADTSAATEVLNAISADSREQVDELIATALDAGGSEHKPVLEQGPMYGGSFCDPDGHVWELVHMTS